MAEELKKIKKVRAVDKKNMSWLTHKQRARLEELTDRKEVGQFLLSDAPPSKKRRQKSVTGSSAVRFATGHPRSSAPHVLQPWELQKLALDASAPSRAEIEELEERAATSPPLNEHQFVFTPSTGVITFEEGQEVDENLLVDAFVELVGFSPSTSFSAERLTLQNFSPGPSMSSTQPEPSIYEENLEEDILQWERSAGQNPGSDVEDEDSLDDIGLRELVGELAVDDLSSELREVLGSIDRQDDLALRESSQEDLLTFDWSHDPPVFTGVRETFVGPAGPTFPTEGKSPFQIFSKIWYEDIINLIVNETRCSKSPGQPVACKIFAPQALDATNARRVVDLFWDYYAAKHCPNPCRTAILDPMFALFKIGQLQGHYAFKPLPAYKALPTFCRQHVVCQRYPDKTGKN